MILSSVSSSFLLFTLLFNNVSSTVLHSVNRGSFKLKLHGGLLLTTEDSVLVNSLKNNKLNHYKVIGLTEYIKNQVTSHISKNCFATTRSCNIEYKSYSNRNSSWSVNVELTVYTTIDRLRSVPNCMRRIPTCRNFLAEIKSQEPRCEVLNCNDVFRLNRDLWNCVRPRITSPTTSVTTTKQITIQPITIPKCENIINKALTSKSTTFPVTTKANVATQEAVKESITTTERTTEEVITGSSGIATEKVINEGTNKTTNNQEETTETETMNEQEQTVTTTSLEPVTEASNNQETTNDSETQAQTKVPTETVTEGAIVERTTEATTEQEKTKTSESIVETTTSLEPVTEAANNQETTSEATQTETNVPTAPVTEVSIVERTSEATTEQENTEASESTTAETTVTVSLEPVTEAVNNEATTSETTQAETNVPTEPVTVFQTTTGAVNEEQQQKSEGAVSLEPVTQELTTNEA